jgi:hypothetical protein
MTERVDEIATSSNQNTVELLAMMDLDNYFHPYLRSQGDLEVL